MAFSTVPLTESLAQCGFVVLDQFLPEDLVQALFDECQQQWRNDQFDRAGIGADLDFQIVEKVRNNLVLWWDPMALTAAQQGFCEQLEHLKDRLNQDLFLGLQTFETHYAGYPKGSFYKRHEDSFRNRNNRRISMTFYLNRDWREEDGGALVLYPPDGETQRILPEWNRAVLFLSEGMPHEVLPTQRTRFLIANWFKNREWPLK